MRTVATLAWMLLRGGGRRDLGTVVLGAVAFAVATALLLVTAGFNLGFADRADRQAWTTPTADAGPSAAAVQSTRTEFYDGQPVVVVALGQLSPTAPVPPGLPAFPAAGQQWRSPALARLAASDPGALSARWPGRVEGRIGPDGLTGPDQLMAVVGVDPASPVLQAPAVDDVTGALAGSGPSPVSTFSQRAGTGAGPLYRDLALVASVLLVVPLVTLAGAAARLGVARRDQRMAGLRLVGASSRQLYWLVAAEAGLTALLGGLTGAAAYAAVIPLVARLPFGGGTWFGADLWVGRNVLAGVLAGVALLGAASAVATLRRAVVSPLGVTQRHTPTGRHLWRAGLFAAALVGFLVLSRRADPSLVVLVVGFAVVFVALAVIGPWVMALLGHLMVALARSPARLIAGRRLLDDPRAAWRTVAGLALTGFVAGFLALFPSSSTQVLNGSPDTLDVAVPAGSAIQAWGLAENALYAEGLPHEVRSGQGPGALLFVSLVAATGTDYLSVPVQERDRERARTALHRALPGAPIAGGLDTAGQQALFGADVQRASTAVLTASFLVAIASAGITASASVLDRRRTYRALHLAGVPRSLLDKARRHETDGPLLLLVSGAVGTGLLCSAPLTRLGLGSEGLDLAGVALLAGTVAAGLVGVRLAAAVSRPLLRTVATSSRTD